MCTNAIDTLEFDASTAKRAQYEAFDFELEAPGLVTVRNESVSVMPVKHSEIDRMTSGDERRPLWKAGI